MLNKYVGNILIVAFVHSHFKTDNIKLMYFVYSFFVMLLLYFRDIQLRNCSKFKVDIGTQSKRLMQIEERFNYLRYSFRGIIF